MCAAESGPGPGPSARARRPLGGCCRPSVEAQFRKLRAVSWRIPLILNTGSVLGTSLTLDCFRENVLL